ncbi:MAG: GNAT family N-acetyltransferase [Propionibacteriaceae bacterium]|jgi:mycothiol synthase|nr:GNAT family N-acetyltransferase [Propionibacteriaceae bacterium]
MPIAVRTVPLSDSVADRIRQIDRAATAADGLSPFNDTAHLYLGAPGGRVLVAVNDDGVVVGAAIVVEGAAQVVVDPAWRRRGAGRALVSTLRLGETGVEPGETSASPIASDKVDLWSFGDHPGARALAAEFGLTAVRALLIMERDLIADPPSPTPAPPGTLIREFEPDDLDAVVALNALAFRHHPEQGQLTIGDFEQRMMTDWFDPDGLLLAVDTAPGNDDVAAAQHRLVRDGRLLGFHWTKIHPADEPRPATRTASSLQTLTDPERAADTTDSEFPRDLALSPNADNGRIPRTPTPGNETRGRLTSEPTPFGEVYVLAVAPEAAHHGWGRRLLERGLDYLAGREVTEVILYVEGDEDRVVSLYQRSGFHEVRRDLRYAATKEEGS